MEAQALPDSFIVAISGVLPVADFGATILAVGVLGQDISKRPQQNLTFSMSTSTVVVPGISGPPPALPAPTAAPCASCRYGVIISGGIDPDMNWNGYWEDVVYAYKFLKSQGLCDANIKVFYHDGVAPDGRVAPAEVRPATGAGITAHLATVAAGIPGCANPNKPPALWVITTDHGTSDGSISLKRPSPLAAPELYTPLQLRAALQPVLNAGLGQLEVRMAQCFAGTTQDTLEGLDPKSCAIRIATAAGRAEIGWSWIAKGSRWLQRALQGDASEQPLLTANAQYDLETQNLIAANQSVLTSMDAAIVGTANPVLKAALTKVRVDYAAEVARFQSARGKQHYFHSVQFTRPNQALDVQVTPGGRVELRFSGNKKYTGNTTAYTKVGPSWVKDVRWTWNIPNSSGFHTGYDLRKLSSPPSASGLYRLVDDQPLFRIEARSFNPSGSVPALATLPGSAPGLAEDDEQSPSNSELFAGFTIGDDDSTSDEFGDITLPTVIATDGVGLDLGELPRVLGGGGASSIQMTFPVPRQNQWWDDTELLVKVVSGSGSLRVQSANAQFADVTIPVPGPGEYTAHLGAITGTGDHTLTLGSLSGSVDLDVWALRSLAPIPDPATITDFAASPLPVSGGHYVHTENTCAAEELVDHVPLTGCSDPSSFLSGRDVVYRFALTQAATLEIDALGSGNADEQMLVFTNPADPLGTCVAARDQVTGGPGSEHISGLALGAGTYYVSASVADAGCGDVTLTIDSSYPLDVGDRAGGGAAFYPSVPNPFRDEATLSFRLPKDGDVRIELYDLAGHRVRTLADGHWAAGTHQVVLSGRKLAPGVYLSRMTVAGQSFTRRILLVR